MTFRIFTPAHPEGIVRTAVRGLFPDDVLDALTDDGVARLRCPCCDKRIVLRWSDDETVMTAEDREFLGITAS